ncbi:MAG: STAS domain-containing protein [Clostridia bacterium]|nr:STAS domain-containing protein [Clostridia bacterium]
MTFELKESKGIIIVSVEGQVRISTQNEFKDYLDKLFENHGSKIVVLDMENVSYMNSAGIGIIVDTFKNFRDAGGRLVLSGLAPDITKLFEVTKLNRFIEIYTYVDDAVSKLVL